MFTGVFSHHNRVLVIKKPNQACKDSSIGPLELNLLLSLWLRIVELDEVICTDSPTFKLSRRAILSCWFRWLIRLSLAPPKRLNVLCCLLRFLFRKQVWPLSMSLVLVSLVARQYPRNQSCELLWPVFCFLEAVFVSQWLCHVSFFCQVTCLRCAYIIVSLWQLFTCEQECYFLVSFLNRMLCPTFTEFTLILCLHLMVKYCQQNLFQAHVSYH